MICEDDFEFCDSESIGNLAAILEHDPAVDLIGGRLHDPSVGRDYTGMMKVDRGGLIITPVNSDWQEVNGLFYRQTDLTWNYFLARREVLEAHPWDEDLRLREHCPFFWTLKQAGVGVYFTPCARIRHYRDRPNREYNDARNDNRDLMPVIESRYGWRSVLFLTGTDARRTRSTNFSTLENRCAARLATIDFSIEFPEAMPFCGTLLGMVRDGDVIPWDCDVDFAVRCDAPDFSRRKGPFRRMRTFHHQGMESEWAYLHLPTGIKVDLFRLLPFDCGYQLVAYPDEFPDRPTVVRDFGPLCALDVSDERSIWGHRFNFPAEPEACLTAMYGADWQTPNPDYDPHAPFDSEVAYA